MYINTHTFYVMWSIYLSLDNLGIEAFDGAQLVAEIADQHAVIARRGDAHATAARPIARVLDHKLPRRHHAAAAGLALVRRLAGGVLLLLLLLLLDDEVRAEVERVGALAHTAEAVLGLQHLRAPDEAAVARGTQVEVARTAAAAVRGVLDPAAIAVVAGLGILRQEAGRWSHPSSRQDGEAGR
jgi:hypothetical protein